MGKRGRVQKKYRQKYSLQLTMQDSTSETTNLESECIHIETPMFDKSVSNESINQDRTPEFVLLENKKMSCYNDMSPRMNTRLPKLKLNLDLPENNDMEDEKNNTVREKNYFESTKDLEKTLSVENVFENESSTGSTLKANDLTKCFSLNLKADSELVDVPRKDVTSLSGYFQIPSSTFNLPGVSIEAGSSPLHVFPSEPIQGNFCIGNAVSSNSDCGDNIDFEIINSNVRDNCLLLDKNSFSAQECCIKIIGKEKIQSTKTVLNIYTDKSWDSTLENNTCIHLPVVSDVDSRTGSESRIPVALNNTSDIAFLTSEKEGHVLFKKLKSSFIKMRTFCSRLAETCVICLKKVLSVTIARSNSRRLGNSELAQVIDTLKCENEQILLVLSEQISSLSQKLTEIQATSEANLQVLKSEMNKVVTVNIQLRETSKDLVKELKMLQEKVQEIKSASLESRTIPKNSVSVEPPILPIIKVTGPPPPPPPPLPPPPPPPPILLTLKSNYPIKPNDRLNSNTPKFSTPSNSRPAITVEDLLKVTLKKAPQHLKDNRKNTVPGPRGPVISLDMLRNVKLKSTRRRSLDQHRSPRASRLTRNRSQSNVNLSPRAESSLSRMLKPTAADTNKRVFKKNSFCLQ